VVVPHDGGAGDIHLEWRKGIGLCALGAAMCAGALSIGARRAHGQLHVGLSGGALVPASDLSLPDASLGVGAGSSYAVETGWLLGKRLELGLRWQQVFASLDLDDDSVTGTALDVGALTAGARFFVLGTEESLRPWVALHVGWYHADGAVDQVSGVPARGRPAPEVSTERRGDTMGLNVGGGLDVEIAERLSVGLELRYHYTAELNFLTPLVGFRVRFSP
jgi:hypothetical protein